MSDKFCKIFEVDGSQVVAMTCGDGEEPETTKFRQATQIDGIFVDASMDVPYQRIDKSFDDYGEKEALKFYKIVHKMIHSDEPF